MCQFHTFGKRPLSNTKGVKEISSQGLLEKKIYTKTEIMRSLKAIILLMFVLAAMQINAQSSIKPISATVHFDNGSQPCIQVNLDPEPETLKHAWKDYLKDNYDLKLKGIGFLSS